MVSAWYHRVGPVQIQIVKRDKLEKDKWIEISKSWDYLNLVLENVHDEWVWVNRRIS